MFNLIFVKLVLVLDDMTNLQGVMRLSLTLSLGGGAKDRSVANLQDSFGPRHLSIIRLE